jgi:hypothetical protein
MPDAKRAIHSCGGPRVLDAKRAITTLYRSDDPRGRRPGHGLGVRQPKKTARKLSFDDG